MNQSSRGFVITRRNEASSALVHCKKLRNNHEAIQTPVRTKRGCASLAAPSTGFCESNIIEGGGAGSGTNSKGLADAVHRARSKVVLPISSSVLAFGTFSSQRGRPAWLVLCGRGNHPCASYPGKMRSESHKQLNSINDSLSNTDGLLDKIVFPPLRMDCQQRRDVFRGAVEVLMKHAETLLAHQTLLLIAD